MANREIKAIYDYPVTKINFVKRTGMVIYDQYPHLAKEFIESVKKKNLKNDKDFCSMIEVEFREIFENNHLNSIFIDILEENNER